MEQTVMTIQDAKRAYALNLLATLRAKGNTNAVIVMPVFINEGTDEQPQWEPTSEVALDGPNPEWCAINVVTSKRTFDNGFMNEQYRSALIRMKRTSNTFKAGEVLPGIIYIMESTVPANAANLEQDVKYINNEAQANQLPCTIEGEWIYRRAFYTEDTTRADVRIQHDNDDEIRDELARIRAAANTPQTKAIKDLAAKKGAATKK